jgi:hypothetical protein
VFLNLALYLHTVWWLNVVPEFVQMFEWNMYSSDRLVLSKGPNWVGVFRPSHLRTETDPVS